MGGFWKQWFGTGKVGAPATGPGAVQSVYSAMIQSTEMSAKQCGVCGETFADPKDTLKLITASPGSWKLDVGGYCPKCRMYRCPKHAKFTSEVAAEKENVKLYALVITCSTCKTQLT